MYRGTAGPTAAPTEAVVVAAPLAAMGAVMAEMDAAGEGTDARAGEIGTMMVGAATGEAAGVGARVSATTVVDAMTEDDAEPASATGG